MKKYIYILLIFVLIFTGCTEKQPDRRLDIISSEFYKIADEIGVNSTAEINEYVLEALFDINTNNIHSYFGLLSLNDEDSSTFLYIYTESEKSLEILDKFREYSEIFAGEKKYHIFRVVDRCFLMQGNFINFDELEARLTELAR